MDFKSDCLCPLLNFFRLKLLRPGIFEIIDMKSFNMKSLT